MTDRNDEYNQTRSTGRQGQRQQAKGQGGQQYGRHQGQPGYQSQQYQPQSHQQSQPSQQSGSPAGRQHHASEEYTAQDYGRAQAHGQEGLEREYGQSLDRGFGDTSYGEQARSTYAQGARGGRDYQRQRQGLGGAQDYSGYAGRQQGEGYGSSSGYGNPDSDSYNDNGGYQGTSFVSPADTQQTHAGMGRRSYSGMGPKNYTRSDERITEDLCERLTMDSDIDASDVEVKVAQGTATLEGTVSQRWMKHRAEDLADGCSGVRNVENRIKVQSESSQGGSSTQRSGSQADTVAGRTGSSTGTAH